MFTWIFAGVPLLIAVVQLLGFLVSGKRVVDRIVYGLAEIGAMIVLPCVYIHVSFGNKNDCCDPLTPAFSPDHQLTIIVLILLCVSAYAYCSIRTKIAAPVVEVLVNVLLLIGIVLNILIGIHVDMIWIAIIGNGPVIIMAALALVKNQQLFLRHAEEAGFVPGNRLENMAWQVLNLQPAWKIPVILLLCLPVLVILSSLLLIFGQKPDSLIRAFTDTYKHGLSQLDFECDNVACGGHFLCSVAANGHTGIVKPQRTGIRNNGKIICNRQLLIANAFEDLVQGKAPRLHWHIRKQYDKVGDLVHRYYGVFNNKFVADLIYILMKPLEWIFLLVLYTFDRNPENRIHKQYLSRTHRLWIDVLQAIKQ